jgi:T4 RnlA family RNA ligase
MNKQGMSPIFEYTSPKARIVINYAQEQMSLLAIRNLKTGEYQSRAALETSADVYGVPCVEVSKLSALEVLETIDNIPNKEGFVFQFNNGEMVKLKTSSYLTLHHTVVFQRERDIAEMVLDEKLDDYKGYLKDSKSDESLVKVHAIEKRVIEELNTIMTGLDSLFSQAVVGDITRKDIAAKYNKHKYFSLLMKKLDGHDMDSHVKEYFKKNLLKEMFSLEQI